MIAAAATGVILAIVAAVAAVLGLYCLLRWAITAPAAIGRHRGDLAARMVARHRREQLERELGWAES